MTFEEKFQLARADALATRLVLQGILIVLENANLISRASFQQTVETGLRDVLKTVAKDEAAAKMLTAAIASVQEIFERPPELGAPT